MKTVSVEHRQEKAERKTEGKCYLLIYSFNCRINTLHDCHVLVVNVCEHGLCQRAVDNFTPFQFLARSCLNVPSHVCRSAQMQSFRSTHTRNPAVDYIFLCFPVNARLSHWLHWITIVLFSHILLFSLLKRWTCQQQSDCTDEAEQTGLRLQLMHFYFRFCEFCDVSARRMLSGETQCLQAWLIKCFFVVFFKHDLALTPPRQKEARCLVWARHVCDAYNLPGQNTFYPTGKEVKIERENKG